jgi:hypothetical protein
VQLADHRGDPGPGGRGSQVLHTDGPVLGIGLQVGPFAEVVLDVFQQLHGRVGGGHPPGWAVLMDQDEPGAVDLQDRPGRLRDPLQPREQVIGLGQRGRKSLTVRATIRRSWNTAGCPGGWEVIYALAVSSLTACSARLESL